MGIFFRPWRIHAYGQDRVSGVVARVTAYNSSTEHWKDEGSSVAVEFTAGFNSFSFTRFHMDARERRATILEGMVKRRQWGMNYRPLEQTASKLPARERRKALDTIDELVQDGLAEYHKNRGCVSLVPSRKGEVERFLREHGSMPDWELDALM